jgi:predicted metal-dependent phosphoesterase TrpH
VLNRLSRECYSDPEQLYHLLHRRGMNLVTITDHDSVEGAARLLQYPDVFLSEEVTCRMPAGTTIHVGVYDITERQHAQIQRRRDDLVALLIYLTERRIFFSINHVFSSLTGPRSREDFAWFENYFPAVETLNGQLLAGLNSRADHLARLWRKPAVGGSDAHTPASAASAYTQVPGARSKEEFFAGLRAGRSRVGGRSGSYATLTREVLLLASRAVRERTWKAILVPLMFAIPAVTLVNYGREVAFGHLWASRAVKEYKERQRPFRIAAPSIMGEEA